MLYLPVAAAARVSIITVILRWYGLEKLVRRMSISLKVHESTSSGELSPALFSIHCFKLQLGRCKRCRVTSVGWGSIRNILCLFGLWTGECDHSAMSVSGFHSCRLGPRSTRDLIFQLPTASVCPAPRFLSLLPNWGTGHKSWFSGFVDISYFT